MLSQVELHQICWPNTSSSEKIENQIRQHHSQSPLLPPSGTHPAIPRRYQLYPLVGLLLHALSFQCQTGMGETSLWGTRRALGGGSVATAPQALHTSESRRGPRT